MASRKPASNVNSMKPATKTQQAKRGFQRSTQSSIHSQSTKISKDVITRIDLTKSDVKSVEDVIKQVGVNAKAVEFLYLRNNFIRSLTGGLHELQTLKLLDLSENEISSLEGLRGANLTHLRQLYLSSNRLSSIAELPSLPALELLSLTRNQITDFQGMQTFPNLALLFLDDNNIKSLIGLSPLPKLEVLTMKNNPVERSQSYRMSLAMACNGNSLLKLDEREFTDDERAQLAKYTWKHRETVRYGWMLSPDDRVDEESNQYLIWMQRQATREQVVKLIDIDCPVSVLLEGARITVSFSFDTSQLSAVGAVNLDAFHYRYQWYRCYTDSSVEPLHGATQTSYTPTINDVGCCFRVECTPVLPDGRALRPLFVLTNVVKSAAPSASVVRLEGDACEGDTLRAITEYSGGVEGASIRRWYRCATGSAPLLMDVPNPSEYVLDPEDVNCKICFEYVPVRADGVAGSPAFATTAIVVSRRPSVRKIVLEGEPMEGETLHFSAQYVGGQPGLCRVQWLRVLDTQELLMAEAEGRGDIVSAYQLGRDDAGYTIRVDYTPVRVDGVHGDIQSVETKTAVRMAFSSPDSHEVVPVNASPPARAAATAGFALPGSSLAMDSPPSPPPTAKVVRGVFDSEGEDDEEEQSRVSPTQHGGNIQDALEDEGAHGIAYPEKLELPVESVALTGDAIVGTRLVGSVVFKTADAPPCTYEWFRSEDGEDFEEIRAAYNQTEYVVTNEDLGCYVKFVPSPFGFEHCDDILDAVAGPVVAPIPDGPALSSLELVGLLEVGEMLTVVAECDDGSEAQSRVLWYRVDGEEDTDAVLEEHTDNQLFVTESHTYVLQPADLGCRLKVVFMPLNPPGDSESMVTDVIQQAPPAVLELRIEGSLCEKGELSVRETLSESSAPALTRFAWYRVPREGNEDLGKELLGNDRNLITTAADVGHLIMVQCTPVGLDRQAGQVAQAVTAATISPAPPAVTNVRINSLGQDGHGRQSFMGSGEYSGGLEGESQFVWRRMEEDGTVTVIDDATSVQYAVSDADNNCRLQFGYLPVRSDHTQGSLVFSPPTEPLSMEIEVVRELSIRGKCIEGQALTALVLMKGSRDKAIALDFAFQWYRTRVPDPDAPGMDLSPYLLPGANGNVYTCTLDDVGYAVKVVCQPSHPSMRIQAASAISSEIFPGPPVASNVQISHGDSHASPLVASADYFGGTPALPLVQWHRSVAETDHEFEPIVGATSTTYQPTAEDAGFLIQVEWTPVRSDGKHGTPETRTIGPLPMDAEVLAALENARTTGRASWSVWQCDAVGAAAAAQCSLEAWPGRVAISGVEHPFGLNSRVTLDQGDPCRFTLSFEDGAVVGLVAIAPLVRDCVWMVLRNWVASAQSDSSKGKKKWSGLGSLFGGKKK